MGDTVLVHVTTFNGRTQNSEQMGEQGVFGGRAAYPNLPVYVVCPIDRKGTAAPYTESTYCPSVATWNRENVKIL